MPSNRWTFPGVILKDWDFGHQTCHNGGIAKSAREDSRGGQQQQRQQQQQQQQRQQQRQQPRQQQQQQQPRQQQRQQQETVSHYQSQQVNQQQKRPPNMSRVVSNIPQQITSQLLQQHESNHSGFQSERHRSGVGGCQKNNRTLSSLFVDNDDFSSGLYHLVSSLSTAASATSFNGTAPRVNQDFTSRLVHDRKNNQRMGMAQKPGRRPKPETIPSNYQSNTRYLHQRNLPPSQQATISTPVNHYTMRDPPNEMKYVQGPVLPYVPATQFQASKTAANTLQYSNRQTNRMEPLRKQDHHLAQGKRGSPYTDWFYLIPAYKEWSEISLAVYKVGVAMYHSSVVCDAVEWHFWQGYGVEARRRYFHEGHQQFVSIDHLPFVVTVPMETLMIPPRRIAALCAELAATQFSKDTYDIVKCNCNHFTAEVLRQLGLQAKIPSWINRLAIAADSLCYRFPFVRNWIDAFLNRSEIINRDAPDETHPFLEHKIMQQHKTLPPSSSSPPLIHSVDHAFNDPVIYQPKLASHFPACVSQAEIREASNLSGGVSWHE